MILVITLMVFFGLMIIVGYTIIMTGIADSPGNEAATGLEDDESRVPEVEHSGRAFFRGKEIYRGWQASISLHDLKAMLRDGQVRQTLPWLLAFGGLFGLVTMIGPLLWYLLEEKWVAYVWMAATAYFIGNIGWQYLRDSGES
jgi:hypothetical protein